VEVFSEKRHFEGEIAARRRRNLHIKADAKSNRARQRYDALGLLLATSRATHQLCVQDPDACGHDRLDVNKPVVVASKKAIALPRLFFLRLAGAPFFLGQLPLLRFK
jgi:hypothetical protein